jgi:hypothetical protein
MPEQDPARRGAGGWIAAGLSVWSNRHYGPHNLGGLCEKCGHAIPAAIAGESTFHPTCEPGWPALLVSLKRALARRERGER